MKQIRRREPRIFKTAMFVLWAIYMTVSAPAYCASVEAAERFANELKQNELGVHFGTGKNQSVKKDIALLVLQLEEMRLRYARETYFNSIGILSATKLQMTRCAYEKVQVQLAGKVNRLQEIPERLTKQRALANAFQKETARAEGRPEIYSGSPLKLPAPAKTPGAAPLRE